MKKNPYARTAAADKARSRDWTGRFLASPADLSISFMLDGKRIAGVPPEWSPVTTQRRMDANIVETITLKGLNGTVAMTAEY